MEGDIRHNGNFSFGMDGDSRHNATFNYGVPSRVGRSDQILPHQLMLPQPRTLTVPVETANPLDLTSAIVHQLQRSNGQQAWLAWQQQLVASSSSYEPPNSLHPHFGALPSYQHGSASSSFVPQYIPRFDEEIGSALQMPTRLSYTPEAEFLASTQQGFYPGSHSTPPSDADGRLPVDALLLNPPQAMEPRMELMRRSCSPWVDRIMQADVTPTPCPSLCISTSLSLAKRGLEDGFGDVSCVASQIVDLQSCHSNDMQRSEKSLPSGISSDPQRDSTVETSTDLFTDDDDLETQPIDEKRKKRMLSNRASAQRSRQRRQERLDQLEVLTAQLRVENFTLQKKLSMALQVAKKFEDQNKLLLKKVQGCSKDLDSGKQKTAVGTLDECASSQQTTCASSCEMVGGRISMDTSLRRDGYVHDGASTPSMSERSPDWPSGTNLAENEAEPGFVISSSAEVRPLRKSQSPFRMGKKRSHGQSEALGGSHSTSLGNHMGSGSGSGVEYSADKSIRPRPPSPATGFVGGNTSLLEPKSLSTDCCDPLGLDSTTKDEDNIVDSFETDRWLEFAECLK